MLAAVVDVVVAAVALVAVVVLVAAAVVVIAVVVTSAYGDVLVVAVAAAVVVVVATAPPPSHPIPSHTKPISSRMKPSARGESNPEGMNLVVLDVAGGSSGVGILQASQSGRKSRKAYCSHFMMVATIPPAMRLHEDVVASNH